MPYLGNVPAEAYTNTVKDSFNGDASTTAFTLSQPSTTNNLRVVVENVIQDPTVAYSVSGTTLTFTSAPPVGTANIYAVHLGPAVQTAVPPSEINNATTYTSDLTVQGAFTSAGIDDNATSTAMTLDSNGDVLVGTTSFSSTTAGIKLDEAGDIAANRDGSAAAFFGRLTSDGEIVRFRKDGTTVGSISVAGGNNLQIASTAADHAGLGFGTHVVAPLEANADSDGTINLGASNARFKDLYLSGGVYLGGTGSANLLDDVEYGTYSIADASGGAALNTVRYAVYKKIGQFVQVEFDIDYSTNSDGNYARLTLPFTPNVTYFSGIVGWSNNAVPVKIHGSSSGAYLMNCGDPGAGNTHITNANLSAKRLIGSFYYTTS